MQSLLANAPDNAKECLRSQLGKLASRASCEGPWTTNAQVSLSLDPVKLRWFIIAIGVALTGYYFAKVYF